MFPLVVKPMRGRGSHGVARVDTIKEFSEKAASIQDTGRKFILKEYLVGRNFTLTIMPPGVYKHRKEAFEVNCYWSLSPVERFNHIKEIAPYNVTVAVVKNSIVIEETTEKVRELKKHCETAAALVELDFYPSCRGKVARSGKRR